MKQILIYLCIVCFSHTAMADLDCGKESISLDFEETWTTEKVELLCGKPQNIKNWKEEVLYQGLDTTTFVKHSINYSLWTYDRGSHTFIEYLLFKNGVLIEIKDGFYGKD